MKYLDTDTLNLEKDSFINKELKENYSDLLFSANIDGKESYVYFLFEHKSYPDKTVHFQLLKYMAEIWDLKMRKEKLNKSGRIYKTSKKINIQKEAKSQ